MSKSKGNVVDPVEPIKEFGPDAVRYFLLSEIALGNDGNYSREGLIRRWNTDLANDLGNLQYRTVSMIENITKGLSIRPLRIMPMTRLLRPLQKKRLPVTVRPWMNTRSMTR